MLLLTDWVTIREFFDRIYLLVDVCACLSLNFEAILFLPNLSLLSGLQEPHLFCLCLVFYIS